MIKRPTGSAPKPNSHDTAVQAVTTVDPQMRHIIETGKRMWPHVLPYIKGQPPGIQAGLLADLAATWLSGVKIEGNPEGTDQRRQDLMVSYFRMVEELTALDLKILDGRVVLY